MGLRDTRASPLPTGVRVVDAALMPNMTPSPPGRRAYIPAALLLLGVTFLLVGFARPEVHVKKAGEGATIVFAVDVSGSMGANDVLPTRLGAADASITELLTKLPAKYRASLISFSNHPTLLVPPTYSRQEITSALPRRAVAHGTALGDAVAAAVQIAAKASAPAKPDVAHPSATVLLISDGGQNAGKVQPPVAAAFARKSGVTVSTIAVGTAHGSVSQRIKIGGKTYTQVKQVPVETNVLQQVAATSDGQFLQAGSAAQLRQVYQHLRGLPSQGKKKPVEITGWVIAVALVLIVCAIVLSGIWFRRLI